MPHKIIDVPGYDAILEDAMRSYAPQRREWTKEEEEKLSRYYNKVDINILCSTLGKTKDSIRSKVERMGLKK